MDYARLVLFTLGPGMRSTAEEVADTMIPKVREREGFRNVTFLEDDEAGEYGVFILWDSKEHAEASKEALFPVLLEALSDKVKSPPALKLFEVYEPAR